MIYRLYVSTFAIDGEPDEECEHHEIRNFPNKQAGWKAFNEAIDAHAPTQPNGEPYRDAIVHRWHETGALIDGFSFFSWEARVHGTISLVELPGDE